MLFALLFRHRFSDRFFYWFYMVFGVPWAPSLGPMSKQTAPKSRKRWAAGFPWPPLVHIMLHVRDVGVPQTPSGPFRDAILVNFKCFQDTIWVDFRLHSRGEFANINPLFIICWSQLHAPLHNMFRESFKDVLGGGDISSVWSIVLGVAGAALGWSCCWNDRWRCCSSTSGRFC